MKIHQAKKRGVLVVALIATRPNFGPSIWSNSPTLSGTILT